ECRNIRRLVSGVHHHQKDVNNRLGNEPKHRSRTNVLHDYRPFSKSTLDPLSFAGEILGPNRIVFYEGNRRIMGLEFTHRNPLELFFAHRWRRILTLCQSSVAPIFQDTARLSIGIFFSGIEEAEAFAQSGWVGKTSPTFWLAEEEVNGSHASYYTR